MTTADGMEPNGILPVDKPEGPTSHDVVARARRALSTRRIGHTGTLDPFASGLLLLCVGPATRLAEYLVGLDKTYIAGIRLGSRTDTDDRTGAVLASSEAWRELEPGVIRLAAESFKGELLQVPPAYSAKKVAGERMYDRARRGEIVELPPVPVIVHGLSILALEPPELTVEIECSSGTYIRAIARDLGEKLGVGAHLDGLRRTRIGGHDVATAVPAACLDDQEAVRKAWLPPTAALEHFVRVEVSPAQAREIGHGGPVAAPDSLITGVSVAITQDGQLIAIGEVAGGMLRPRKVFL